MIKIEILIERERFRHCEYTLGPIGESLKAGAIEGSGYISDQNGTMVGSWKFWDADEED